MRPIPTRAPFWITFLEADPYLQDWVLHAIAVGPDGALWLATDSGVLRYDGATWRSYTTAHGLPHPNVLAVDVGPAGRIWAGTWDGIARLDDGNTRWTSFEKPYQGRNDQVWGLAAAPDGALWLADGLALTRFDGQTWTPLRPFGGGEPQMIESLAIPADGSIWFGTMEGAYRLADGQLTHYTAADGLAADHVDAVALGPDGAFWFGTPQGASRFDGQSWTTYTTADGLIHDQVLDIALAPDGALWFATRGGISVLRPAGEQVDQVAPSPAATVFPSPTPPPTRTPQPTRAATVEPTLAPLPAYFEPVATIEDGLQAGWPRLLAPAADQLWLLTNQAAVSFAGPHWAPRAVDLHGDTPLGVDNSGRLWALNADGSQIAARDGVRWTTFDAAAGWIPIPEDSGYNTVQGEATDAGDFWVTAGGQLRLYDGARWIVHDLATMTIPPPAEPNWWPDLTATYAAETGLLWVTGCFWGGPGPFGGPGVRWYEGAAGWQGAESPVSEGCASALREGPDGDIWLLLDDTLWHSDPLGTTWQAYPAPPPPEEGTWYGFAHLLELDPAASGPYVLLARCGGASCYDGTDLYRLTPADGVWHRVDTGPLPGSVSLIFDAEGTPWLLGPGLLARIQGDQLLSLDSLWLQAVAVDPGGRIWGLVGRSGEQILGILHLTDLP